MDGLQPTDSGTPMLLSVILALLSLILVLLRTRVKEQVKPPERLDRGDKRPDSDPPS